MREGGPTRAEGPAVHPSGIFVPSRGIGMTQGGQSSDVVRFGSYEVHLRGGELYRAGRKIKLQLQPFHVLAMLLEHPGEVVAREDLQRRLWPGDTFVDFDHSLNTAIKKLRLALGDDNRKPRFVETLPKRGYRFIGRLEHGAPPLSAKPPVPSSGVGQLARLRADGNLSFALV